MKIAFLISPFEGGGAERVITNLANGFAEKGFIVNIVVLNLAGKYHEEISGNVKTVNLRSKRIFFALNRYLNPGL